LLDPLAPNRAPVKRNRVPGDQGDLFLQANPRFLSLWFDELSSSPLQITVFTEPAAPEGKHQMLLVESHLTELPGENGEKIGNGRSCYPKDETAVGLHRFAALVSDYVRPPGR